MLKNRKKTQGLSKNAQSSERLKNKTLLVAGFSPDPVKKIENNKK